MKSTVEQIQIVWFIIYNENFLFFSVTSNHALSSRLEGSEGTNIFH
jgi:hypothetical protein